MQDLLEELKQLLAQDERLVTEEGELLKNRIVELGLKLDAEIRISMDGRGRALDNIFVERLWRTVKYEDIYIREYNSLAALTRGLEAYFHFYNYERYHQSLDYAVPAAVHLPVTE